MTPQFPFARTVPSSVPTPSPNPRDPPDGAGRRLPPDKHTVAVKTNRTPRRSSPPDGSLGDRCPGRWGPAHGQPLLNFVSGP